jgi:apolipoprotein N-acyltransferase
MTWSAVICAILSGAGFYFSFNLGDQWWLAWLAPVPILWLAFGPAPRALVFAASFVAYGIGLSNVLPAYGHLFPAAILALAFIVLPGIFALIVLDAGFIARRFSPWMGALGFGALWAAADYLATFNPSGAFPAFVTQAGAPMAIQSAAFLGPWAISFLLGAVSAALALGLRKRSAPLIAAALSLFAANLGFGALRMAMAPATESVRVGLAVSDSDNAAAETASRSMSERVLARYARATATLAAQGADFILLPEEVARLEPQWRDRFLAAEQSRALQSKADLVMGFRDHDGKITRNIALIFSKNGGAPGVYVKRHLIVPGPESVLEPGTRAFVRPDKVGVEICKDMDFPATLRADVRQGGTNLMLVPAWDFDLDGWAHARFAILRGAENGFAMARAARRGLLTLTDGYGRLIAAETSHPGMTLLVGDLPRGPGPTFYTRIGDVFAWICLALAGLLNLGASVARKPNADL